MANPVYYTGDTHPPLSGTVKDAAGAPVDISAADSLRLIAKLTDGADLIVGTPTNLDLGDVGTRGKWEYVWAVSDLSVAGDYVPEIEVTWPGGPPTKIETFRTDTEKFTIRADND